MNEPSTLPKTLIDMRKAIDELKQRIKKSSTQISISEGTDAAYVLYSNYNIEKKVSGTSIQNGLDAL